jgi:hypothetical protein
MVILHEGDRAELKGFASDYYSETKRRLTNLFSAPRVTEVRDRLLEDRLIHKSSRGEPMRSKSEVVIADQFAAAGVDYEYETPLVAPDGSTRWPDFTLTDSDTGRIVYWEHCGMMQVPDYRERWRRKLAWYRAQGILPMVTEDDPRGGIDAHAIRARIDALFA